MTERCKRRLSLIAFTACSAISEPVVAQHYQCGTHADKSVLLLPVPDSPGSIVNVRLHGRQVPAIYSASGLTQYWVFDVGETENLKSPVGLYVELDHHHASGFVAKYMDFRGAAPDEQRKPTSVFFCEFG